MSQHKNLLLNFFLYLLFPSLSCCFWPAGVSTTTGSCACTHVPTHTHTHIFKFWTLWVCECVWEREQESSRAYHLLGFPSGTVVKNLPANAGDSRDTGLIPGSGRSPGGGHGNPLQYSCLENSMDRGAWWAAVHGIAKSRTWLSMYTLMKITASWASLIKIKS